MKNMVGNYNKSNLVSLLDFPFDFKISSTRNLDNKWLFYKNILGHYVAEKDDPKLSGGISAVSVTLNPVVVEDRLNKVLDTLLYGIVYGSMPKWKANDWLAKHHIEAFKNADQLKNINYEDYNIIKINPYETGQYKGHNPKYDIYSEDQYLFIKDGRDTFGDSIAPINLVEAIPISFNRDNYNRVIIYWQGYVRGINLSNFKDNYVFFTSKSNLIAGIKEDSFTEQTITAELLDK